MTLPARVKHGVVATAATGALFSLVALALFGARAGASVVVGASLATANLYLLARLVRRRTEAGRAGAPFFVLFKMTALLFVAFVVLKTGLADPLPFVAGSMALPVGLVIGSLASDRLLPPEE